MQDVLDLLKKNREELKEITSQTDVIREKRDALAEEIAPVERKIRELNKEIKRLEQPRKAELMTSIRELEKFEKKFAPAPEQTELKITHEE